MKQSSKPMSSPGRTEKYPPPLMRFLRSNVGSRSRGRSRSSPMFVRKKNTAIETQEPSSPKVTCIGQVRVRRSNQTGNKPGRSQAPARHRCWWVPSALCCRNLHGKLKHKTFRPFFGKLVLYCQHGFQRKAEGRGNSSKFESKFEGKDEEIERHYEQSNIEEEDKNLMYSSSTPPKNALLLTRCRSAPYGTSSLASRFWGSPLVMEETEKEAQKTVFQHREQQSQHIENDDPTSEIEPSYRDSAAESRTDPESKEIMGLCSKDFEASVNSKERSAKFVKIEGLKTGEVCSVTVRPVILTRCKSEPARTAEKLHPEAIFWRKEKVWFR